MDEELRNLERKAMQGDPEAIAKLARRQERVSHLLALWAEFADLFNDAQTYPCDGERVNALVSFARGLGATGQENSGLVFTAGPFAHTPENASWVVVLGGSFGDEAFKRAKNVLVVDGDFAGRAFFQAENVIVCGGVVGGSSFAGAKRVTVRGGLFEHGSFALADDVIVDGGTFVQNAFLNAEGVVSLGARYNPNQQGHFFSNARDVVLYFPGAIDGLSAPDIGVVGASAIGWSAPVQAGMLRQGLRFFCQVRVGGDTKTELGLPGSVEQHLLDTKPLPRAPDFSKASRGQIPILLARFIENLPRPEQRGFLSRVRSWFGG